LDVVVRKSSAILKLLSGKDESLLIWGNTFLVLDFGFDIFNGVSWFDVQSDSLSCEGFDEDLHATSESEDQVKSRLLLDVVIRESSTVFKLLSGEDESLLIWWDSFLVLDFGLHIFNGVSGFDIQCDCFTSKGFDEDLHSTSKSENQVKG